jgi:GH24 family phage-related lysozyme (muramidase)
MRTSSDDAKAICCWEACVLVAYADPPGQDKTYSIGFGSQKPSVRPGDTIDLTGAFRRLRGHLDLNDGWMHNLLPIEVPQHAWGALASFVYNSNSQAVQDVFGWISKLGLERGALSMAKWDKGKKGIAIRRAEEIFRVTHDWYGDISKFKLYEGDPHTTQPRMVEFPQEI